MSLGHPCVVYTRFYTLSGPTALGLPNPVYLHVARIGLAKTLVDLKKIARVIYNYNYNVSGWGPAAGCS